MTYLEKYMQEHPEDKRQPGVIADKLCPTHMSRNTDTDRCKIIGSCWKCWNLEIPGTEKTEEPKKCIGLTYEEKQKLLRFVLELSDEERDHLLADFATVTDVKEENGGVTVTDEPTIKDSGDRTEFATGAVRDMREGKGRCDLMPLDVMSAFMGEYENNCDPIIGCIYLFQNNNRAADLYCALNNFCKKAYLGNEQTMFLEVAKHFEEGAKKYGENNWQKGIPTWCYIDSAVRHYLKWLRGDKDEPHDRAFVWNILCCIWTIEHESELKEVQHAK